MIADDHPLAEQAPALERIPGTFMWVEAYEAEIEDGEINNPRGQGQPCAPDRHRGSAVKSYCGSSALGNRADDPKCAEHRRNGALARDVNWHFSSRHEPVLRGRGLTW